MICQKSLARVRQVSRRPMGPGPCPASGIRHVVYRILKVQAALKSPDDDQKPDAREMLLEAGSRAERKCVDVLSKAVAAGCVVWTALSGSAMAAVEGTDPTVMGPTSDMLLGVGGDEFSFTSLLLYTLLGYWFIKAMQYLNKHTPDGPERDDGKDDTQQQQGGQQGGGAGMSDMGHAHIRSYVDSSQPGPGGWLDARDLRNASLARSAAYRVTATVRESQPRIHTLVEELAGPGPASQWPLRPPRHADVDFVAAMAYDRVVKERMAKGADAGALTPRERAALETRLLEEVAERAAVDQVTEFIQLAAQGKLHPRQHGGGGAGHPPPSPAH